MSDQTPDQNLHLPSLVIKNFRGIDELTIPRLGRVTLLTGKNGVGKTTVLDAVRIWADRGLDRHVCSLSSLVERGDFDIGAERQIPKSRLERLFYGRIVFLSTAISIGSQIARIPWKYGPLFRRSPPRMRL